MNGGSTVCVLQTCFTCFPEASDSQRSVQDEVHDLRSPVSRWSTARDQPERQRLQEQQSSESMTTVADLSISLNNRNLGILLCRVIFFHDC